MSRSQEERQNEIGAASLGDVPLPTASPPLQLRTEDLPSRSYYSSHIGHDPNTGAQYSASSESIRAQSLALADLYMKDDSAAPVKKHIDREGMPYLHPQKSSPKAKTTSPSSNLSRLLQRKNDVPTTEPEATEANESQPLLGSHLEVTRTTSTQYHSIANSIPSLDSPVPRRQSEELEAFATTASDGDIKNAKLWTNAARRVRSSLSSLSTTSKHPMTLVHMTLYRIVSSIPAVILGVLLNLLDAISYGMITFPLNNPIFASFGPDGISMFFVSCIVAQLVYSCGGSAFAGGNGSMMIEVVPFLHIMAEKIVDAVGEENQKQIVASTVVAFAFSSIITGIAFFLLGALNLGALMGFFPRHILVGTIGGVGWFLVATGIEVSGRLEENLAYTLPMLKKLFLDTHTFALWSSALGAALILRLIQYRYTSALVVPSFFMLLPGAFYLVIAIFGLDINQVRDAGWIFPLVDSNLPFWHFYTYYDFTLVDWSAVAQTIPAMLALTFFGVLHVPINVPALGVSTNNDNIDTNRELIAHGVSNAVSGLLGSVQNYLVYTNSLLFIRSGGDSRLAGLLLAGATAALWMVGPWIVGYIPVIVVGSLIFHLGLDLLKEALVDTWRSVNSLEYITICVIIACMSALGFVEGILVGIIMACVFFVVQNARNNDTIRSTHTGSELRSTVRRVFQQQKFLKQAGRQIQVIRLQGYLFFGTVNQVERAIRDMLDERAWDLSPIRFLILDMQLVQGLDFSAAEAFVRIRRLLSMREVYMIVCNVAQHSDVAKALVKAGVWNTDSEWHETIDLKCFESLNDALEWCENRLIQSYFDRIARRRTSTTGPIKFDQDAENNADIHIDMISNASPRHKMLIKAAQQTIPFAKRRDSFSHKNFPQPTLLLMQAFSDLSEQDIPVEFYHKLGTYLESTTYARGQVVWKEGDPCDCLVVLEQGTLRSLVSGIKEEDVVVETILPGTVVGELGLFIGSHHRARSLVAEQDSVLWKLTRPSFEKMKREDPGVANQFILLSLHFSSERLDIMTRYAFQLH